jgi:hypothetical protein
MKKNIFLMALSFVFAISLPIFASNNVASDQNLVDEQEEDSSIAALNFCAKNGKTDVDAVDYLGYLCYSLFGLKECEKDNAKCSDLLSKVGLLLKAVVGQRLGNNLFLTMVSVLKAEAASKESDQAKMKEHLSFAIYQM